MTQSKLRPNRPRLWLAAAVLLTLAGPAPAGETVTQADLLKRMLDLDRLYAAPPPGETPFLFSAPAGAKPRTTDDGWSILAEVNGPGAIQTIWTEQSDGELRIVTDDQPAVDGKWTDFFSGGIDPFGPPYCFFTRGETGGNCWLPMGFSKGCKVLSKGNAGAYAISGTRFPAGTQVARFDGRFDAPALERLEAVGKAFKGGIPEKELFRGRKMMPISTAEDLKTRGKVSIDIEEPCIIRALYVSITDPHAPREAYAHHNLVLRVFYGDAKDAAVETPLSAFFGSGFDRWPYKSSVMGTDIQLDMPLENPNEGWFFYCYFPIPVIDSARIEIENLNTRKIGVMLFARAERVAPPPDALRFYARYRWFPRAKPGDLTLGEFTGVGRIVGSVLLADCPRPDWWGAGDLRIACDGGGPLAASGAAAWFATVEGFELQRHAFNGVTLKSQNGKYSAYRWFVGDSFSFRNGARLTLTNTQLGNASDVAFGHAVHWYGAPSAKVAFKPLKPADLELPGLRLPGAVELEGNLEGENWGSLLKQSHLTGVELSGDAAVNITTTDKVTAIIRTPADGEYLLKVRMVPGRSFKPVKFLDSSGKLLAELAWTPTNTYIWDIGRVKLVKGENRVGIQCSEKASIDCWILQPAPAEEKSP
ncbi:MAG: hypothetical protein AMXMBFR47_10070 [Planctomycetota bacterium]